MLVAPGGDGGDRVFQNSLICQSRFQPLGLKAADFTLCHVQPRSMRWRVMECHTGEEGSCFLVAPYFRETATQMGIEVVQNQVDMGSGPVFLHAVVPEKVGRVGGCSALSDRDCSFTDQRINGHKQITRAVSFVLVVEPAHGARRARLAAPGRAEQLLGYFVKAMQLVASRKRFSVERQDVVHPFPEERRELGDAPHFFPARA